MEYLLLIKEMYNLKISERIFNALMELLHKRIEKSFGCSLMICSYSWINELLGTAKRIGATELKTATTVEVGLARK
jgi:hypothetical protein